MRLGTRNKLRARATRATPTLRPAMSRTTFSHGRRLLPPACATGVLHLPDGKPIDANGIDGDGKGAGSRVAVTVRGECREERLPSGRAAVTAPQHPPGKPGQRPQPHDAGRL